MDPPILIMQWCYLQIKLIVSSQGQVIREKIKFLETYFFLRIGQFKIIQQKKSKSFSPGDTRIHIRFSPAVQYVFFALSGQKMNKTCIVLPEIFSKNRFREFSTNSIPSFGKIMSGFCVKLRTDRRTDMGQSIGPTFYLCRSVGPKNT